MLAQSSIPFMSSSTPSAASQIWHVSESIVLVSLGVGRIVPTWVLYHIAPRDATPGDRVPVAPWGNQGESFKDFGDLREIFKD